MAIFRRRKRRPFWQRLGRWLSSHNVWKRAAIYCVYRLKRSPGSAHFVAAGFASGAVISFTPLLGLHILMSSIAALLTRGSVMASLIGTVLGNPLTFPLYWLISYYTGTIVMGQTFKAEHMSLDDPIQETYASAWDFMYGNFWEYLVPTTIGGFICAVIFWPVFYIPVKTVIKSYQKRRRKKLKRRWNELQALRKEEISLNS